MPRLRCEGHHVGVGYDYEKLSPITEAHTSLSGDAIPAWTLTGVEALARPGLQVVAEATAASDPDNRS